MNEFEWRRQLRALRQPVTPRQGLWLVIDATLTGAAADAAAPAHARSTARRWLLGAGLAASILFAGTLGGHLWPATALPVEHTSPGHWRPADPRLTGAAIELDTARLELRQALQQNPHSPVLQRLLTRTRQQQNRLRQLAREAG
jgi:hypothetical protein